MKPFFSPFLVLLVLLLASGCAWIEDLRDGKKPPPETPLIPSSVPEKQYTPEEAVSLICTKLVMKFSMSEPPTSVVCPAGDTMAARVERQLARTRLYSQGSSNPFFFRSEPSPSGTWRFVAVRGKTGKIILDETLALKGF